MTHSLDLGPDAGINARLTDLRLADRPRAPQANDQPLVPGIFFNADPEGRVTIEAASPPGRLLDLQFTVDGPARWLALHIGVDALDLGGRMLFGLAIRAQAAKSLSFRACLRSGHAEGFTDTFFRKTAIAYAEPSLHLDALMTADHPALANPATWRELILFFRPETAALDLQDMRVFIL